MLIIGVVWGIDTDHCGIERRREEFGIIGFKSWTL
jgi:hypothetical protein